MCRVPLLALSRARQPLAAPLDDAAAPPPPTAQRQGTLVRLVRQDCGSRATGCA